MWQKGWQKGHRCGKSGTNVAKVAPMWWARALWQEKINRKQGYTSITFLKPIAVFCGTHNMLHNIPHIEVECEKYFTEYCQSHKTLILV